mgnify:FL=1|jgi:hypothetical protein
MEYVDLISSIWPIFVGFIILVLTIGKLMSRMDVVEDKIKTLFDLWNKRND